MPREPGRTNAGKAPSRVRLLADQRGATAVEYGLIAALVVVACIAGFAALGGASGEGWDAVAAKVIAALGV